jgi:hypothetical protein
MAVRPLQRRLGKRGRRRIVQPAPAVCGVAGFARPPRGGRAILAASIVAGPRAMAEATLDIDYFIRMDRRAVRVYLAAAALIVLVGGAVIVVSFAGGAAAPQSNADLLIKLGGFLMSLVGLVPFKEGWARWERIDTLRAIKARFEALSRDPSAPDPDLAQVREMVNRLYAKFLAV